MREFFQIISEYPITSLFLAILIGGILEVICTTIQNIVLILKNKHNDKSD